MKNHKPIPNAIIILLCAVSMPCQAQTITESAQKLSKEAQKGYIDEVRMEPDGNIHVIYQNKIEKKSAAVNYEDYVFDKSLKFIEKKGTSENKEVKPDKKVKVMNAFVGGTKCNSFDVLSMKVRVVTATRVYSNWNYKKQRYEKVKDEDVEAGKIRSDEDKPYYGIESWWREDDNKLAILGYVETKDKKNPKRYVILNVDFDGNVTEKALDVTGNYSVVYSQMISETEAGKPVGKQDFIVLLAPQKGSPNISEYVYLHYDMAGTLKNKVIFQTQNPATLYTNATVIDGSVYLFGQSLDGKKAFEEVFEDYAEIEGPCFIGSGGDAENPQRAKYNKAANEEMDNFHIMRISGGKVDFATMAPLKNLKAKMKTPPSDKGASPYKGKKFSIHKFEVTPDNEYLIAGQLLGRANVGSLQNPLFLTTYGDIVCLHLDSKGELKAQYAVDRMFETKKSAIFEMPQSFYFGADGKTVYWEILEAKGERDFWTGSIENVEYYPRITKIDLEKTSIADFKVFGGKKYFVYQTFPGTFVPEQNCIVYFGKDDNESVLWVGKASFD